MAAVTERLRFITFVLKLPIRHPVLVAKQATSTAVLTGGRLALGVGISPWREDFDVLGVPWERRGKRMDECLAVLRGLSSGDFFLQRRAPSPSRRSRSARCPRPACPCWSVDTGSRPCAGRRSTATAGSTAAGTRPTCPGSPPGQSAASRPRTAAEPFEVHVISMDGFSLDGVRRLEDVGVTDVIVGFRWPYEVGPDIEPSNPNWTSCAGTPRR